MNIKNVTNYVVRNDTVNAFVSEISKIPVLTAQEERDLFAVHESYVKDSEKCTAAINELLNPENKCDDVAARDREILGYRRRIECNEEKAIELRNEIISRNLRFVYAVAKRYDNNDKLADLINTGMLGMYEAFEKYDWHSGNRFSTLAVWFIRRSINAYLEKEDRVVRQKNGARIVPKVKRIENDFFLRNGRKPTPSEVVDILKNDFGIDAEEVDVCGIKVDKIESYIGDDDDFTFEDSQAFNERTSTDNGFEEKSDMEYNRYVITEALKTLTDREKTIVSMAYGYGYPREYKDKEIGAALGLTSERIRQLRHGAVKKLRSAYLAASER